MASKYPHLRQLGHTRARAWTLRMRNHHQGWPIVGQLDDGIGGPGRGQLADLAGRTFVLQKCVSAEDSGRRPGKTEDYSENDLCLSIHNRRTQLLGAGLIPIEAE